MSGRPTQEQIDQTVQSILDGYRTYRRYFQEITARAQDRFLSCDWIGAQSDAGERLDAYQKILQKVVTTIRDRLGAFSSEHRLWAGVKSAITCRLDQGADPDLGETFYNSVVRRLGHIIGANPELEFLNKSPRPLPDPRPGRDYQTFTVGRDSLNTLCRAILENSPLHAHFQDLGRDAGRMAEYFSECRADAEDPKAIDHVDMITSPFFRGMGAYLIGRVVLEDGACHPLAIALLNEDGAVAVDGIITDTRGIRLLFSYTHSYFHVSTDHILELIAFLKPLLPHRRLAELYISLGFNRHGKTELYRDLAEHQNACRDIFAISPGKPGMVMAVFNMPSDDMVFKVIRDRFAQPKRTTRREVIAIYDYIFRHDRTGRLPDTQSFEHLKFDRGCFHPDLLQELFSTAAQSVTISHQDVAIELAYVERRVHPLDLYLAEASHQDAVAAVIDFGQAIKDLALSNIFPGDMLLKNFGVTGLGRVIFYDFDEICPLTECHFRRKPTAISHEDEMAAEPWFFVGENDIFPEEFESFLGLTGDLKEVFLVHHKDLLNVAFWQQTQAQIRSGTPIHVFPYTRLETCRSEPTTTEN